MTREPTDEISLTRALAILAATFAIVFASLLPSAVAASASTDSPVQLCSGQIVRVMLDADGHPVPAEDDDRATLTCAMALLSGLQAVDVGRRRQGLTWNAFMNLNPTPMATNPAKIMSNKNVANPITRRPTPWGLRKSASPRAV